MRGGWPPRDDSPGCSSAGAENVTVDIGPMPTAILPWLVPLLIVLAAITVWPPLTLWLPGVVMGR